MVSAYRVERLLGTGGMGWVYRAMHVLEARYVALKVLREDQLRQDRAIDRMMREAQILATVPHGGIPTFYECGLLPDGRPWIAMELVEGTPLSVQIVERSLDHDRVLAMIGEVAGVLAAAHQRGVTHRDLKPDNILLTPNDPTYPLRVIDWGIAHQIAGARYTHHDEAIGTPTYMAPEQARGGPSEGHCDIYGLGVVAYQALAGRAPFVGKTSVEILVQHLNKQPPPLAPRLRIEIDSRVRVKIDDEQRPRRCGFVHQAGEREAPVTILVEAAPGDHRAVATVRLEVRLELEPRAIALRSGDEERRPAAHAAMRRPLAIRKRGRGQQRENSE